MALKLSDDRMASNSLLLCLGDMLEGVALHRHNGGDLSLVWRHLVKLLVQLELEVHRPELYELIEEGGGPADIPHLGLLVVSHLRVSSLLESQTDRQTDRQRVKK